jgi:4'-phosphopantetheinyl transferase
VNIRDDVFIGGQVHLWTYDLSKAEECPSDWNLLSVEEQQRAQRIGVTDKQAQYVLSRIFLRRLLGFYLMEAPSDIEFTIGPFGKPELSKRMGGGGLRFNLSHTQGLAICGVSTHLRIGVDTEGPRRIPTLDALAKKCLSQQEYAAWLSLDDGQRASQFQALWCAKEAFSKAVGRGIALGLETIELKPDLSGFMKIPLGYGSVDDWYLHLEHHQQYLIAVCFEQRPAEIRNFDYKVEALGA